MENDNISNQYGSKEKEKEENRLRAKLDFYKNFVEWFTENRYIGRHENRWMFVKLKIESLDKNWDRYWVVWKYYLYAKKVLKEIEEEVLYLNYRYDNALVKYKAREKRLQAVINKEKWKNEWITNLREHEIYTKRNAITNRIEAALEEMEKILRNKLKQEKYWLLSWDIETLIYRINRFKNHILGYYGLKEEKIEFNKIEIFYYVRIKKNNKNKKYYY